MKTIIKLLLSVTGFLLFASGHSQYHISHESRQEKGFNIETNSFHEFSGTLFTAGFSASEVNTPEGLFSRLSLPEHSYTEVYGHPEMPANRKLIRVPLGAEAVVTITHFEYEDIDLAKEGIMAPIYPAQPPMSKSQDMHEFMYDATAYANRGFESHELLSVDMLGILRDKRIARINFIPFRYDPVRHVLRVYHRIDFSIYFENADIAATLALEEKYASPVFRSVNRQLLNAETSANRENFMRYPVKYVIISDRMFESQLQDFIQWKTQKGFIVVEAYTDEQGVGGSLSSIKSYIQGLYDAGTPESPAPSYVLFVGDIQQIPSWNNGNGVTDRNYCEFTGDLFPEIYYGRFSAQNPVQLQPYIDKTLQYEKYTMPDPDYLNEVVMVAGMDGSHGYNWANGQINYGTINYFNPDHGITSHTYLYPQSGSNSLQIQQNISDGVTYGNYTAHCSPNGWADPSFTISDIANLQNQDKYGVLVGNCCSSSEYQLNECFAEAIVRAENKGAVGYIGASNSTYWDEDYYFAVGVGLINQNPPSYYETTLGFYDRAFHDHGEEFSEWYVSTHEMIFAGNLAVTEGAPGMAMYYWDVYNIIGDPSLMVYFSEPPVTAATYLPLLPLQSISFTVTTEAYAYVGLSLDNEYIGAALAGPDGIAILEFPPLTEEGIADVTVTRQNGQPFFGTVLITSPAGPYLMIDEITIVDTSGNNNQFADFGEDISLNISLENLGNGDAANTVTNLSGDDDYITITKDNHSWPVIPGQSILTEEGVFNISIASDVPDMHTVILDIEIENTSKETWIYPYELIIHAPELTIGSMIIDDSQGGNGNGRLDPGETAILKIVNRNTGHCETTGTVGELISTSQYLTLDNSIDTIGDLGLLGFKYSEYLVNVDPDAPDGSAIAEFTYLLTSGEYSATKDFSKKIGLIYEDFETGNFTKFDWQMSGEKPWQITSLNPYEGSYSARSGNIADNESSVLYIDVEVMLPDSVTFIYKVSSQSGKDKLKFYINNVMMGEWSGVGGSWTREAFAVNPGNHTFKWVYGKDAAGMSGHDCAWLDFITFPALMTLTCYAGPDDYTCTGEAYQCHGQATDWVAVEWSTSGDGSFDDPYILEPYYTPGPGDIASGIVELTLAVEDAEGSTVDDEMTLSVIDAPGTPEIPDGPSYVNLYQVSASDYTTQAVSHAEFYQWTVDPSDAGEFSGNGTTGTITWNASFLGTASIAVRAVNNCGESGFSESLEVFVDNSTMLNELPDEIRFKLYPNPGTGRFNLAASGHIGHARVRICNILGKEVYNRILNILPGHNTEIDLENAPKGLYILSITSGTNRYTQKLILK